MTKQTETSIPTKHSMHDPIIYTTLWHPEI